MKTIHQYTAYISAYIFLCAVIKYFIYYKTFGVVILDFVDVQQLFTYFLENIMAYLVLTILVIFQLYWIFIRKKRISNWTYGDLISPFKNNVWFFCSITVFSYLYYLINPGVDLIDFIIIESTLILFYFLNPVVFIFLLLEFKLKKCQSGAIVLSVLLLFFSISNGLNESRKVLKNHNIFYGYEIKLKGAPIIRSDDSLTYVGITESYLFIFNKLSRMSTIYKTEDLEFLNFKKR